MHLPYRREIDGLRALAVLPVILFHAGFKQLSGGYVGVDIFFVISGYLITLIILSEKQAGTFTLLSFYERRARRILPAFFVVLLACLPFAWLWLLPADFKNFADSMVAASTFTSNIYFWQSSGYFETASELKPLLHTWSLSVEEQYYVLFPLFIMLTWRLGRRWIVSILVCAAIASAAAMLWIGRSTVHPDSFAFFMLPARGWEILLGALLAFYVSQRKAIHESQFFSLLGLTLILLSIGLLYQYLPYPRLTFVPTIGAALILLFATPRTWVGKLLGSRFFVGIGLISYSAYLWHQPLFAFIRYRSFTPPSLLLMSALVVATLGLAFLSWKYIETPFRNRQRFKLQHVFVFGGVCSLMFIMMGESGSLTQGYPQRLKPADQQILKAIVMPKIDNGWCFYSIDTIHSLTVGESGLGCHVGDQSSTKKALLFGDSFAGHYEPFWDIVGRQEHLDITSISTNWCYSALGAGFVGPASSPAYSQCKYNRHYLQSNLPEYDYVILSSNWHDVLRWHRMGEVFDLIKTTSKHAKMVIIMPSPKTFDADLGANYGKNLFYQTAFDIHKFSAEKDQLTQAANHALQLESKKYRNVFYIERDAIFNVKGLPSDLTADGVPFSWDGSHISVYGSKKAAEAFMATPQFLALNAKLTHAP